MKNKLKENNCNVFTKEDLKKAFLAGANKENWTEIKLSDVVAGERFILEPIFDNWFEHPK